MGPLVHLSKTYFLFRKTGDLKLFKPTTDSCTLKHSKGEFLALLQIDILRNTLKVQGINSFVKVFLHYTQYLLSKI